MWRVPSSYSKKLRAYKKVIDGSSFIEPDIIRLENVPMNGDNLPVVERSLRAQTAQGERTALAKSDAARATTQMSFILKAYAPPLSQNLILEWLQHGKDHGFGQWRNASWGSIFRAAHRFRVRCRSAKSSERPRCGIDGDEKVSEPIIHQR